MTRRRPWVHQTVTGAARRCLAIIVSVLALAGCGRSATSTGALKVTTNPSGPLGSALPVSDSSGTNLDVTVEQVIDPASGANIYSKPAAGKHFVGVKLSVHNAAIKNYQNNANNETTIVTSSGQQLKADYNPIAGCGNFDNGQITLNGGASKEGCVTFQVPNGATVVTVRYGNTVFPGTVAQWRVS